MTEHPPRRDLGQLSTVDGRSVLRFERHYRHPREKVWRALTEPEHLAQWFPAEVRWELRPGAPIEFRHPGEDEPGPGGTVLTVQPPELIEFTWGDDILRWELLVHDDGCLLRFTSTFDDRAGAGSFATGWTGCLDAFGAVLDGEPVAEPDGTAFAALHERYVAAFDLTAGEVRDAPGGSEVRFERQLMMVPVPALWAALTAATPAAVGERPPAPASHPDIAAGAVTDWREPIGDRQYTGGMPTADEPVAVLEYEWLSDSDVAGRVRWQVYPGPGGARIVLTQTIPAALAEARASALTAWRTHIERLASDLTPAG